MLLVGDATYDYRRYLGPGIENEIPAPMVPVEFSGETTSDAVLADVDNDGMADLAVGRWPVDDRQEVSNLVERTVAYELGQPSGRAIFAADGTETEFERINKQVISTAGLDGEILHQTGATSDELTQQWNEGAWLLFYNGHGSLNRWGKDDVFSSEAVSLLSGESNPPMVLQFTCLTGYFAHPSITSLSESLLAHNQGPVLIVAPSSLTVSASQLPFATALLARIADSNYARIGDAFLDAKRTLQINDDDRLRQVNDTFGLLGDPSAMIIRPQR